MKELLMQWSLSASQANLLAILLGHSGKSLPMLAGVMVPVWNMSHWKMFRWQFLAVSTAIMSAAWFGYALVTDWPLLLSSASLLALSGWTWHELRRIARYQADEDEQPLRIVWMIFLTGALSAQLASSVAFAEFHWFNRYATGAPGWLGYADLSMIAVNQTLWAAASFTLLLAFVLYMVRLMQHIWGRGDTTWTLKTY